MWCVLRLELYRFVGVEAADTDTTKITCTDRQIERERKRKRQSKRKMGKNGPDSGQQMLKEQIVNEYDISIWCKLLQTHKHTHTQAHGHVQAEAETDMQQ